MYELGLSIGATSKQIRQTLAANPPQKGAIAAEAKISKQGGQTKKGRPFKRMAPLAHRHVLSTRTPRRDTSAWINIRYKEACCMKEEDPATKMYRAPAKLGSWYTCSLTPESTVR